MSYTTVLAGLHERLETITGTAASLAVNPAGANNALLWTAVAKGWAGNQISVTYVAPATPGATLALTLTGAAISVSLATDGAGAVSTTAAQLAAAAAAHASIGLLVTCANVAPDDGSGKVTAMVQGYLTGGGGAIVEVLDYAPTAIHDVPMIYTLLENVEYSESGQVKTQRYRIQHRLLVRWQDNEQAEIEAQPYVDSIPAAVRADPHLGGRLTSGYAQITECQAGWVTIAGVEYRSLDFISTVVEKG
jgi:hypothetical protein